MAPWGTGGAFLLYYFIIDRLGSVRAAGATYIPPVVAVIIGACVGEQVSEIEILALILILAGVVMIQTGKHAPRPIPQGRRPLNPAPERWQPWLRAQPRNVAPPST